MPTKIVKFSQMFDRTRMYVSDSPTPEKIANILRAADDWDVGGLWELQEEMEAKDAQLQGVAATRRSAITALDWDIEPAPESSHSESTAQAVAETVKKELRNIRFIFLDRSIPPGGFTDFLEWNTQGIGPNICATELIWFAGRLVEMVPVPGHRLLRDPYTFQIGVQTDEFPVGVPFNISPNKFAVFSPKPKGGFPFHYTLTHASAKMWMFIHFSSADWLAFSELYGSPWRIGKTDQQPPDADRNTFKEALENLGPDFAAILPKDFDTVLLQAQGTGETYQRQLQWAEDKLAILWLGQTLTTDVGDRGSFAAAKVHDNVRADLLLSDLRAEERFVDEQIIRPMVRFRFPTIADPPIPQFKRLLHERKDLDASRLALERLRLAKELNLKIKDEEAYEALAFSQPEAEPEDQKTATETTAATINELTLGIERATRAGDLGLVNLLRRRIAALLGEAIGDLTALPTAVNNPLDNQGADADGVSSGGL